MYYHKPSPDRMGIISICPRIISVIISYSLPLEAVAHSVIQHKTKTLHCSLHHGDARVRLLPFQQFVAATRRPPLLESLQRQLLCSFNRWWKPSHHQYGKTGHWHCFPLTNWSWSVETWLTFCRRKKPEFLSREQSNYLYPQQFEEAEAERSRSIHCSVLLDSIRRGPWKDKWSVVSVHPLLD